MFAVIFFVWLITSCAVSWTAAQKNRNALGWFVLALLLSPFFAMLMLIAVPAHEQEVRQAAVTPFA